MKTIKKVNVRQATIKTATVTIKTIQIDRKQVTMGTFRQLEEKSPLTKDFTLREGIHPWGYVSYFWKGCSAFTSGELNERTAEYLNLEDSLFWGHLLFEEKGNLFRFALPLRPCKFSCFPERRHSRYGLTSEARKAEGKWNAGITVLEKSYVRVLSHLKRLGQLFIAT